MLVWPAVVVANVKLLSAVSGTFWVNWPLRADPPAMATVVPVGAVTDIVTGSSAQRVT